jgi:hypothetical protein
VSSTGIVGGLGFVALLASVEGGEILKAVLENAREGEGSGTEFDLGPPELGLVAADLRVGGGSTPKKGELFLVIFGYFWLFLVILVIVRTGNCTDAVFCSFVHRLPVSSASSSRPVGLSATYRWRSSRRSGC